MLSPSTTLGVLIPIMLFYATNLLAVSYTFALAMTSNSHNNPASANNEVNILDLQTQHFKRQPYVVMSSIASACKDLGIDEFDVYGDYLKDSQSSHLRKFEEEISKKFGKEDAVFMPSGVMAQNIALAIHSGKCRKIKKTSDSSFCLRFACHQSSHLLLWEENSYSELIGMEAVIIDTRTKTELDGIHIPPIRFPDVKTAFDEQRSIFRKGSSIALSETGLSTFILESPHRELGGKLTPWDDVLRIGELCEKEGVRYHCDGARIFEAAAGYGKSLKQVAEPFDSVYISFYKGLGAISGAMLIGKKEFCDEARIWLRRFGGNLYTLLPYYVSSYAGYKRYECAEVMTFEKRLEQLKCLTQRICDETKFNLVAEFDPVIPETNMIHVYIKVPFVDCIEARDKIIESMGVSIFNRIKQITTADHGYEQGFRAKFEWTIGEANGCLPDDVFVKAWEQFCHETIDKKI